MTQQNAPLAVEAAAAAAQALKDQPSLLGDVSGTLRLNEAAAQ